MSVADRLFGWDLSVIALYADAPDGQDLANDGPDLLADMLSMFTSCRLRITDQDYEARATSEEWDYPLPITSGWSIEVGAVVDGSFPTLTDTRIRFGRGPYVVWMRNKTGEECNGRCLISAPGITAGDDAQEQTATLKGQGPLWPGHTVGGS